MLEIYDIKFRPWRNSSALSRWCNSSSGTLRQIFTIGPLCTRVLRLCLPSLPLITSRQSLVKNSFSGKTNWIVLFLPIKAQPVFEDFVSYNMKVSLRLFEISKESPVEYRLRVRVFATIVPLYFNNILTVRVQEYVDPYHCPQVSSVNGCCGQFSFANRDFLRLKFL